MQKAERTERRTSMDRVQTTIRLPAELKEQLQQEADRRGDSFNDTVVRLIRAGLESQSLRLPPRIPPRPVS